jgi:hypothetical protein
MKGYRPQNPKPSRFRNEFDAPTPNGACFFLGQQTNKQTNKFLTLKMSYEEYLKEAPKAHLFLPKFLGF